MHDILHEEAFFHFILMSSHLVSGCLHITTASILTRDVLSEVNLAHTIHGTYRVKATYTDRVPCNDKLMTKSHDKITKYQADLSSYAWTLAHAHLDTDAAYYGTTLLNKKKESGRSPFLC